jgi:hypothetical protein
MKKFSSLKIIISIIFCCFILISCSDNSTTPVVKSNALGLGSGVEPDESYSCDQLAEMFDSIKINASIQFFYQLTQGKSDNDTIWSNSRSSTSAHFWLNSILFPANPNDYDVCNPVKSVEINGTVIPNSGDHNNYYSETAPFYFGSPNHIVITIGDLLPKLDTTFTFFPKMNILSPAIGAQISANKDLVLKWNGRNDGYVHINIMYMNEEFNVTFPKGEGFVRDDGQFTILSSDLQDTTEFPDGRYIITLVRHETYFPTL